MLRNLLRVRNVNSLFKNGQLLLCNTSSSGHTHTCQKVRNFAAAASDENADIPAGESTNKNTKNPFARETAKQATKPPSPAAVFDNEDDVEPPPPPALTKNPFARAGAATQGVAELAPPLDAAEREKRLKVLQLEADIGCQEGRRVPSLDFFQDAHWDHLLALPTKSARMRYYAYLWQIQMKKEGKERKKAERATHVEERIAAVRKEREENTHIVYGLSGTTMFMRIYDSAINQWHNNRLIRAMQFSPKIVLDCSYDAHMTQREAHNAAKQLMLCFADNRAHDDPFDLHYCNVNLQSPCMRSLQRFIPTMLNLEFPMNVHTQCFTELFPRENLVYLTPHCRTDLEAYNPDDVYIVGAMVDKINNEPLSLAKAKRLNLRMARLPLDRHLQWGAGSGKSLTLDQMIKILLDLKHTGSWQQALQHVPRRKIVDYEQEALQQRHKLNKRAERLDVRIDKIMEFEDNLERPSEQNINVRTRKKDFQFNLDTWASKKKSRNSQ